MVQLFITVEKLIDAYKIEFDTETEQRTAKVYKEQIDKLTEKLLDYKRRIKNLEKAEKAAKENASMPSGDSEELK